MDWVVLLSINSGLNAAWGALSKKRLKEQSSVSFSLLLRLTVLLMLTIPAALHFEVPQAGMFWVAVVCSGIIGATLTTFVLAGYRQDYYSTYALRNTSPLFTWILAVTLLGEPMSGWVIAGTVGVVVGSVFFYRSGGFSSYGLAGAVLVGVNSIFHKLGVSLSSAYIYPFFSYGFSIIALLVYLLLHPQGKSNLGTTFRGWRDVLPVSVLAFFATIFGFLAISLAPITWVAPVARVRLIFGFLLSYFYLREQEGWKQRLTGGLLILAGAAAIIMAGR
jgi:drug/metabolite transporter (DMT)-like permease